MSSREKVLVVRATPRVPKEMLARERIRILSYLPEGWSVVVLNAPFEESAPPVPDPGALLGDVRDELGRMAALAERLVRSLETCRCSRAPETCLRCIAITRRDAARALIQRLPDGGGK